MTDQTKAGNAPDGDPLRGGWRPDNLSAYGFSPSTVLDVGAGRGTPNLYAGFPDSHHVLIEPLQEFEPRLRERLANWRGELLTVAAGDTDGTISIRVNPERMMLSSVYELTGPLDKDATPREVPVRSLDSLREEHGWKPPFGLKVDTEGHEEAVIRGAPGLLRETQFVIAEVSIMPRFVGSYSFADFIELMRSNGFELRDVLDVGRMRTPRRAKFMDALLVPMDR